MPVVSAFLVPGSPLPLLRPDNLPWQRISTAYQRAGRALAASRPDTILLYSTQWFAVLDELWQTRPRVTGVHVDENWYEYGDLEFDLKIDTELAYACTAGTRAIGVPSKPVNYDEFPIDTGTIVAARFMNEGARYPIVLASNNLYHDFALTEKLGAYAAAKAEEMGRRIAVIGVGGLSGTLFTSEIDIREDRIAAPEDDRWNRTVLDMIERGDVTALRKAIPDYVKAAKVDMGFKHMAWILGGLGGKFYGARVHGYGPTYGAGAAVVEFTL
jgi:2-aminophenol/2-amino-5-chlorophenol 1,6-dioxygenase alpha subunit